MKYTIGEILECDGWAQVIGDPPFEEPVVDTFEVEVIAFRDGRYQVTDNDDDLWLIKEEYLRERNRPH
jgi:hypothetical protein